MTSLPPFLDLTGRSVLVTGAARGIGQSVARCLAALGADLVLSDRGPLDETARGIEAAGGRCRSIVGDLLDPGHVEALLSAGPFHALAHVAGVFKAPDGMAPKEAFDFVMGVNLKATIELASACVDRMAEAGGGYVVLVGSAAGRNGGASGGGGLEYAAYAASKGGVHTLVRWLSRRAVGRNVRVNGVAPGVVHTPLVDSIAGTVRFDPALLPMGRLADPEELGWPIALLCTPAASYMSGAVVDVNGGSFVG
jgi:3-oxoacyl-[acyl-carrier protein] reductase